ncbi:MAG: DUF3194 domain-containing protein [Candidatus Bathyarchaeia archaeon]
MEKICEVAERSVRKFLFSKIPPSKVEDINFSVNLEGERPLNVEMELEVIPSKLEEGIDLHILTREALKRAFAEVENYLRDQKLDYNP